MASNNRNPNYFSSMYEAGFPGTDAKSGGQSTGKRGRPPSEKKLLLQQAQAEAAQAQLLAAAAAAARQVASASYQPQESDVVLPVSRIRTIMKSSPDVVQIGHESLIIMTKATEFFIQHLAQEAFERRTTVRDVEYRDLASYVQEEHGGTEFLGEIIPHKIKVRDLAALMTKSQGGADEGDQYEEEEDYST